MSHVDSERKRAIRSAVLRYLCRHPGASDAPPGICAWWLPAEGIREAGWLVEEVLEELAGQQLIRRIELADGTVLYGSKAPDEQTPER